MIPVPYITCGKDMCQLTLNGEKNIPWIWKEEEQKL